jgi:hypothetical protein
MFSDNTAIDWPIFSNGMLAPSGSQQQISEHPARTSLDWQVARRNQNSLTTDIPAEQSVSAVKNAAQPIYYVPKVASREPSERASFSPLQEWEGFVSEIGIDSFTGLLVDLTAKKKRPEEKMEFPISDLSEDDKSLLREGAIFRWSIGYQMQHGTKKRISQIVFRRLPAWTRSDFEASKRKVKEIAENVVWD